MRENETIIHTETLVHRVLLPISDLEKAIQIAKVNGAVSFRIKWINERPNQLTRINFIKMKSADEMKQEAKDEKKAEIKEKTAELATLQEAYDKLHC